MIEILIKNHPDVARFSKKSVSTSYDILHKVGFTPENCIKVIEGYPSILRFKEKDLEERLDVWHVCQFSKTQYFDLFVQCPELLECNDGHYLAKRCAQLQSFAWTAKNIWRLFMSSPNILVDDIKTINEKVDYIFNVMQSDITDLVKSGALGTSITKIKSRHMLLVRLGIYKKRNMKASEMDPNKNPRLFRIMDASDETFATRTCGISLRELEVFYDLYERELEEKKQETLDYEEDTDAESDNDDDTDEEHNFDPRESKDHYDDRHRRKYLKKK